jgi:hypothetical protein
MPTTKTYPKVVDRLSEERSEPAGRVGVPGMTIEIGGESPDLGPWQWEPNIEEARARPGIDRAARWWPVRNGVLASLREGGSEGSHRCAVVANESEAP